MRTSNYFLFTLKETPADAEIVSHQLMLRAGLIRKVSSGIYSWLPLGLRVLQKVMQVVREEMNRIHAHEMLMPSIQPAELWQETGRWEIFGNELLKMTDRHEREFCYGPTHEEVITDLIRREIHSYRELPLTLYQIQTKFRDEIRPRFGVMRAREFLMKDAYSFHLTRECLQRTYDDMYGAYCSIFRRLGLTFRAVLADTGAIGGHASHEFQVLADSGEDTLVYSDGSDYAANLERAEAKPCDNQTPCGKNLEVVHTPGQYTIEEVCNFLSVPAEKTVKTLLVKGKNTPLVALVLQGNHQLNLIKADKLPEIEQPLTFASEEDIQLHLACRPGSIGPVNLPEGIPVIVDVAASALADFICGANQDDTHLKYVNWGKDARCHRIVDIRNVLEGDISPDGHGKLCFARGIEVGHIFQLGNKYSQSMDATVMDEAGFPTVPEMGCYGIGVSRIVAAAIEQSHDDAGIIWPAAMAPFDIALVPIKIQEPAILAQAEELYAQLTKAGFSVLFNDKPERPGVMFSTMDLIGIPHRVVISPKLLEQGLVEYKKRDEQQSQHVELTGIVGFMERMLAIAD